MIYIYNLSVHYPSIMYLPIICCFIIYFLPTIFIYHLPIIYVFNHLSIHLSTYLLIYHYSITKKPWVQRLWHLEFVHCDY